MTGFYGLVMKSRKPTRGKRGDVGRFVTLQSGRKIFIPKGHKSKWADLRDKIKTGAGEKPGKLKGLVPEANLKDLTLGKGGGIYGATTADGEVDTYAYHPGTGRLLVGGPYDYMQHTDLIDKYEGKQFHYDDWLKISLDGDEIVIWTERISRDPEDQIDIAMRAARAFLAAGFPADTPLVLSRHGKRYMEMPLGGARRGG